MLFLGNLWGLHCHFSAVPFFPRSRPSRTFHHLDLPPSASKRRLCNLSWKRVPVRSWQEQKFDQCLPHTPIHTPNMSRYWIGCAPCSDPPYIKLSLCIRWLHVSDLAGSYTFIWWPTHAFAKIMPMLTVMVGWTSLYHDYVEPAVASFFPAGRLTKCSRHIWLKLSYGIQGFNFIALESLPNAFSAPEGNSPHRKLRYMARMANKSAS